MLGYPCANFQLPIASQLANCSQCNLRKFVVDTTKLMKKSVNIYDYVNLIFNTYTSFFETAADNLYVAGQLLPCKTSEQDCVHGEN